MRKVALLLAIVLVISAPITANATSRAALVKPELSFVGTKAMCKVTALETSASAHIVVTMRLYHGANCLASWLVEGDGVVNATRSYPVSACQTYKLVVDVTVNGVAKESAFTTGTCLQDGSMQ